MGAENVRVRKKIDIRRVILSRDIIIMEIDLKRINMIKSELILINEAKCFYQTIFSAAGPGADWALNCFDTEGDEDDNNIHNLTLPTSTAAKYYSYPMSYNITVGR